MELGEKEARRPDAWARTLAIVVARCPVEAARAPLRAAGAYDPRRGGTLPASTHDFRADVLPLLVRANGVAAHRVLGAQRPPAGGRTRQASRDAP